MSDRRGHSPGLPAPEAVLALQRTVGNTAVARLLTRRRTPTSPAVAVQRVHDRDQVLDSLPAVRAEAGLAEVPQASQDALEHQFPKKGGAFKQFPRPVDKAFLIGRLRPADWVRALNSNREDSPEFRRNCVDAARAFLSSWHGRPTPATALSDSEGIEANGPERIKNWLGAGWSTSSWADTGAKLKDAQHGAIAVVSFRPVKPPNDQGDVAGHVVVGVNHKKTVYWIDPQMARVSKTPLYAASGFLMSIVLTGDFQQVDPPMDYSDPHAASRMAEQQQS
ncbi:hypothetical protein FHS29_003781 [Saccharothrix tamanrassetensis]|uniref:Tox-PL domain-containing protein n=1 Tax=Saccharothrix tamanrassetensis TaxID=1051531 RepID=A0A841CM06_9PSEU|nr:toxin glutamine deamidase domain-containing protein [Saccharothrix tamanrassetensis]MBB5957188.1 hypothetical protein [Saccharothrix tamanrassetensis]